MKSQMEDGLYRVVTSNFIAGFELFDGQVVKCAPILRNQINFWKTRGEYIAPSTDQMRKQFEFLFSTIDIEPLIT